MIVSYSCLTLVYVYCIDNNLLLRFISQWFSIFSVF